MSSGFNKATGQLRIIVLGNIVRSPLGGLAWHHLQYVMGLDRLGHDVYFLEDSGDEPWACYDPTRHVTGADATYGLQFAWRTFKRVGLDNRWAYHDALGSRWFGPCAERIHSLCASADLVINLSGSNQLRPWVMEIPLRIYVDHDPVFTQVRHLNDPSRRQRALQHTSFFSFGENLGYGTHAIPDDGFAWQPTRQPVVLDAWPVIPGPMDGRFTTVMSWDMSMKRYLRQYQGQFYGDKSDSFEPYFDLPRRSAVQYEIALGGRRAPRDRFRSKGWMIQDPLEVTRDPWVYQCYIQRSKAEFSVAKHGYVVGRTGWFSERSAAYLASGRPVVVQDTGFADSLPSGAGVIPFSTLEQAITGIEEINNRYKFHCQAAREIAEEYFDARKVLPRLIERAMDDTPAPTTPSGQGSV